MIPTPRMHTDIQRHGHGLFATVRITDADGRTLLTTLRPDIQANDLQVENLKREIANLPRIKAGV